MFFCSIIFPKYPGWFSRRCMYDTCIRMIRMYTYDVKIVVFPEDADQLRQHQLRGKGEGEG